MTDQEAASSTYALRHLHRTIDRLVEDALINCIIGSRVRSRQIFSLYQPSQTVALDCGCATGTNLKTLLSRGCISVGLDLDANLLEKAKSRVPDALFVVGDAVHTPFREETFDFVLCSDVLEHIPEDGKALNEIHRILSEDGIFALTVPIDVERHWVWEIRELFGLDKSFWMRFYYHVREGYQLESLTSLLSQTGFSTEKNAFCYGIFSNFIESLVIGILRKSMKNPSQIRSFNIGNAHKLLLVVYRIVFPFFLAFAYLDFLVPDRYLKSDVVIISRKQYPEEPIHNRRSHNIPPILFRENRLVESEHEHLP